MVIEIGVLSLQGDYEIHIKRLKELNIDTKEVRYKGDFTLLDGLVIPGGESTTISSLIEKQGLYEVINKLSALNQFMEPVQV